MSSKEKYVLSYPTKSSFLTKTYYKHIIKIHTRYHTAKYVLNRRYVPSRASYITKIHRFIQAQSHSWLIHPIYTSAENRPIKGRTTLLSPTGQGHTASRASAQDS